jgi:hypothetical protein
MIPPLDPFALSFDSIELDPTRAPTSDAIAHAFSVCGPAGERRDFDSPGFFLVDDADGRFVVEREMGVVSLKEEALLASESGAVHGVRLRVVEPSGSNYEIELQLRLTGLVPQVVGAEEFAAIAGLEPSAAPVAQPAPAEAKPPLDWSAYAIATAVQPAATLADEDAAFGSLLAATMPSKGGQTAFLTLDAELPAPAARNADWRI